MTLVLGIESSCDETAVAIVDDTRRILANCVRSQYEEHTPYGGVVPEIAARSHIEWLEPVLRRALDESGCAISDMDAIAVTAGPGLIGGVMVGVMAAKALASIYRKPLVAVNHLEGHALTVRLCEDVAFPYLLLLMSGGHCLFAVVHDVGHYELLGASRDDALGEAYDKCAKMMGLAYPGGPKIEQLAKEGDAHAYDFPLPMVGSQGCDMSFSGLKTAVRYQLREMMASGVALSGVQQANVAAAFQSAVLAVLSDRTSQALRIATARLSRVPALVVAGGVAANQAIRGALESVVQHHATSLHVPPVGLCTDNAAMIAWAGLERFQRGWTDSLATEPRARWPLSELSVRSG